MRGIFDVIFRNGVQAYVKGIFLISGCHKTISPRIPRPLKSSGGPKGPSDREGPPGLDGPSGPEVSLGQQGLSGTEGPKEGPARDACSRTAKVTEQRLLRLLHALCDAVGP